MFGSVVLDVALALCLVFLLLSVLCSSMREGIEAWLNSRAVHLHRGIVELLNTERTDLARELFRHPQVSALFEGRYDKAVVEDRPRGTWRLLWPLSRRIRQWWARSRDRTWEPPSTEWAPRRSNLPSYIPARNFAVALVDLIVRGGMSQVNAVSAAPLTVQAIRDGAARFEDQHLARAVLNAFDGLNATVESGMANIEQWYNSAMERVTGWYKKETQVILFTLGLATAIIANVDAVRITRTLYTDKPKRDAIAQVATRMSADSAVLRASAQQVRQSLDSLGLPIGWTRVEWAVGPLAPRFWERISGWFVTAIAVSFGAPFWFDLLSRFVKLRAATKPDEKAETARTTTTTTASGPPAAATAQAPAQRAETGAVPAANQLVTAGATPFQPHEWSSDDDPDGGVI